MLSSEPVEDVQTLLREMSEGSAAAFDRFYEAYIPFVYKVALRLLGNVMDAEDICHDVFLEILRKSAQFDPARGSVEAWLAVKTRSRCLDRLRRRQDYLLERIEREGDTGLTWQSRLSTEEAVVAKIEQETLREALQRIPGTQREAVYGMYFQAQTQKELSERMKRPLGTVKSLVRYGVDNLRKQLSALGWSRPGSPEGVNRHE